MKKYFLLVTLFGNILCAVSQDTSFVSKEGLATRKGQPFEYFRVSQKNPEDTNQVKELFYFKSWKLKEEKSYSNYSKKILDGRNIEYFENGNLKHTVFYKSGKKDGHFKTYWEIGFKKRDELYKDGQFLEGKCFDPSGKEIPFFKYEEMPAFVGGEGALFKFIQNEVKYPAEAKDAKIQGKVFVQFSVDTSGTIGNVKVLRGVHKLLDAEALRVVAKLPKWKPGLIDGDPVNVSYSLPINFVLK